MTERALRAFETYAALGPNRTLAKVAQAFAENGEAVPLPTLKRWSARFHWRSLVRDRDNLSAVEKARKLSELPVAVDDLTILQELKRRFIRRVLGPDSQLSKKELDRLSHQDVQDFERLVKLEHYLAGRSATKRSRYDHVPTAQLPDEDTVKRLRQDIAKRYGLPPDDLQEPPE